MYLTYTKIGLILQKLSRDKNPTPTWSNISDWLSSVLKSADPAKIKPVMFG